MGWWSLKITKDGGVTDADLDRIAQLVKDGCDCGELLDEEKEED